MIGGPGSPEGAPQTDPTKKEETGELTPPVPPAEVTPNAARAAEALSAPIPETGVQAGQAEVKLQPATDMAPVVKTEMSPAPVESKVPTAEPNLVPQPEAPEQGKKGGGLLGFLGFGKKPPKNPESPEAQGGKE